MCSWNGSRASETEMMNIDLLCYSALAINLVAMSQTSAYMLRCLSTLANGMLCLYAIAIDARALIFATTAVILIHIWHLARATRHKESAA